MNACMLNAVKSPPACEICCFKNLTWCWPRRRLLMLRLSETDTDRHTWGTETRTAAVSTATRGVFLSAAPQYEQVGPPDGAEQGRSPARPTPSLDTAEPRSLTAEPPHTHTQPEPSSTHSPAGRDTSSISR
ncbi:hypothetical protein UPYG_G00323600 [Umbra pygmaea]|uniref:Uncharacterized protein n=1 Tax=Umbra pygmaea TaxID=75934 RepID=A0ABD0W1V2_UMBPY